MALHFLDSLRLFHWSSTTCIICRLGLEALLSWDLLFLGRSLYVRNFQFFGAVLIIIFVRSTLFMFYIVRAKFYRIDLC